MSRENYPLHTKMTVNVAKFDKSNSQGGCNLSPMFKRSLAFTKRKRLIWNCQWNKLAAELLFQSLTENAETLINERSCVDLSVGLCNVIRSGDDILSSEKGNWENRSTNGETRHVGLKPACCQILEVSADVCKRHECTSGLPSVASSEHTVPTSARAQTPGFLRFSAWFQTSGRGGGTTTCDWHILWISPSTSGRPQIFPRLVVSPMFCIILLMNQTPRTLVL